MYRLWTCEVSLFSLFRTQKVELSFFSPLYTWDFEAETEINNFTIYKKRNVIAHISLLSLHYIKMTLKSLKP